MAVAYVPVDQIPTFRDLLRPLSIRLVEHDEYDIIETRAGSIDTRASLNLPTYGRAAANYGSNEYGLFIVQFHAPPKAEWFSEVQRQGAFLGGPVIVVGHRLGATPEIMDQIRALRYIQWSTPLHPYLKAAQPPYAPDVLLSVIIEFAKIPGGIEARDRARALLVPGTDKTDSYHVPSSDQGPGLFAVGMMRSADLERVLAEPTAIHFDEYAPPVDLTIPTLNSGALWLLALTLVVTGAAWLR